MWWGPNCPGPNCPGPDCPGPNLPRTFSAFDPQTWNKSQNCLFMLTLYLLGQNLNHCKYHQYQYQWRKASPSTVKPADFCTDSWVLISPQLILGIWIKLETWQVFLQFYKHKLWTCKTKINYQHEVGLCIANQEILAKTATSRHRGFARICKTVQRATEQLRWQIYWLMGYCQVLGGQVKSQNRDLLTRVGGQSIIGVATLD